MDPGVISPTRIPSAAGEPEQPISAIMMTVISHNPRIKVSKW
jgi:hypothetical protein